MPQCPLSIGENHSSLAVCVLELFDSHSLAFYFEMDSNSIYSPRSLLYLGFDISLLFFFFQFSSLTFFYFSFDTRGVSTVLRSDSFG